jgi:hypothetical protein
MTSAGCYVKFCKEMTNKIFAELELLPSSTLKIEDAYSPETLSVFTKPLIIDCTVYNILGCETLKTHRPAI